MPNLNTDDREIEGATPPSTRRAGRQLAYDLIVQAQVTGADVASRAMTLAAQARDADWPDVRALADYAVATAHLWDGTEAVAARQHAETFVGWAEHSSHPFAMALSRCARVGTGRRAGPSAASVDDLVAACETAERIRSRVERAVALHEIAGELHAMRLWELAADLYDQVERLAAGLDEPVALVGALAFNRHHNLTTELLHARQAGDVDAVGRHTGRVAALAAEATHAAVPAQWRPGIDAFKAICHTLTAHDGDDELERQLQPADGGGGAVDDEIIAGLLRCVLAWHHLEHGRHDDAAPLIERGARALLDSVDPTFDTFALWLSARSAGRPIGADVRAAGRRYHRRLLRESEASREALVRSVRARLQTGRLRAERDRYARESLTDSLTGLANRRALESRLATVTPSLTLLMVDIDQFKPVNDRFGHDIGDQVLRRIGSILLECIRAGDLAARLGGDEFVLLLDAADRSVAVRRGYEVRDRVRSEPWHELHRDLQVAVSVGVAWGARSGVALYREADEGLYQAKRAGGARVRGVRDPHAEH